MPITPASLNEGGPEAILPAPPSDVAALAAPEVVLAPPDDGVTVEL